MFTFARFGDALKGAHLPLHAHSSPLYISCHFQVMPKGARKGTSNHFILFPVLFFNLHIINTQKQVYARLSTIQDLLKTFSTDYLRQTNLLLGEGTSLDAGGELINFDNVVSLLPPVGSILPPISIAALPAAEEKKERKKRTHDPNAPKRPLTPYFLYMQTARPIIANDLGPDAPKGAVQEEGQRRWSTMNAHDKGVSCYLQRPSLSSLSDIYLTSSRAGTAPTNTTCASTTLVCTRTSLAMLTPV